MYITCIIILDFLLLYLCLIKLIARQVGNPPSTAMAPLPAPTTTASLPFTMSPTAQLLFPVNPDSIPGMCMLPPSGTKFATQMTAIPQPEQPSYQFPLSHVGGDPELPCPEVPSQGIFYDETMFDTPTPLPSAYSQLDHLVSQAVRARIVSGSYVDLVSLLDTTSADCNENALSIRTMWRAHAAA